MRWTRPAIKTRGVQAAEQRELDVKIPARLVPLYSVRVQVSSMTQLAKTSFADSAKLMITNPATCHQIAVGPDPIVSYPKSILSCN